MSPQHSSSRSAEPSLEQDPISEAFGRAVRQGHAGEGSEGKSTADFEGVPVVPEQTSWCVHDSTALFPTGL